MCTSINQEVVHGIPSASRRVREGDILSLDFGVELGGYFADAALTVPVGKIPPEREKLLRVTRESLDRAIEQSPASATASATFRRPSRNGLRRTAFRWCANSWVTASEPRCTRNRRFRITVQPGHGPRLQEGMVLAIEPMVNSGGPGVRVLDDEWTAVTADGSDSAHFEHTVAVTEQRAVDFDAPEGRNWALLVNA